MVSAVDGLRVEEPRLALLVLPLSLIIIIGLFSIQHRGTAKIGRVFGPVMVLWFGTLALLGLNAIMEFPAVLFALNPVYGFWMFVHAPWIAFFALGAIVLCVTGVESLYADMGHFGPQPIRLAWLGVALPALVLNYFGQAAAVLRRDWAAFEAASWRAIRILPKTCRLRPSAASCTYRENPRSLRSRQRTRPLPACKA